jgi:hypothetical protein
VKRAPKGLGRRQMVELFRNSFLVSLIQILFR